MATLAKLKPGDVVWSVERQRAGNSMLKRTAVFPVEIVEICDGSVRARWNGNEPRRYLPTQIAKWRVTRPEIEKSPFDRAFEAAAARARA